MLDQWPLDDGTLFGWSMEFNPDIAPEITTFEPSIGQGADSTFGTLLAMLTCRLRTLDGVEAVSADGNVAEVLFQTPGAHEFGFYAVNEFGCSADTTVVVEVIEFRMNCSRRGRLGLLRRASATLVRLRQSVRIAPQLGIGQHCWGPNENTSFEFVRMRLETAP